jgi:hypothetical protein
VIPVNRGSLGQVAYNDEIALPLPTIFDTRVTVENGYERQYIRPFAIVIIGVITGWVDLSFIEHIEHDHRRLTYVFDINDTVSTVFVQCRGYWPRRGSALYLIIGERSISFVGYPCIVFKSIDSAESLVRGREIDVWKQELDHLALGFPEMIRCRRFRNTHLVGEFL